MRKGSIFGIFIYFCDRFKDRIVSYVIIRNIYNDENTIQQGFLPSFKCIYINCTKKERNMERFLCNIMRRINSEKLATFAKYFSYINVQIKIM